MNPSEATHAGAAPRSELRSGELHGDRLIAGLWIAMALAVARALLQAAVDTTADRETGATLAEHLLEHVVAATGRVWLIIPPLVLLPRGRTRATALLRALAAFAMSAALLAGWPDGELRYRPGFDSTRGLQGWAAIAVMAVAIAALDRYATSPRRRILAWRPAARFVATTAVLVLGGGALATVDYVLDRRRRNMEVEVIVRDLLGELPRARLTPAPGGELPGAGSILAEKGQFAAGGNKPALLVPVGAAAEFDVDLPRFTSLRFSFGVERAGGWPPGASERTITYAVAVDGVEVLAETVRPQSRPGDRAWIVQSVLLTHREERRAVVALRVRGEGPDLARVRAGFGCPLLVQNEWRPRVTAHPSRMNVVLVVVDSLRPDHLGCHGYARETSPEIDRLAAESIVYENARAPSSWTWPSIASLLTGVGPPAHGVLDFDRCFLADSLETIAEHFARQGRTTLGVSANPFITHVRNFQQGFEEWREFPREPAPRLGEQFRDWVHRFAGYQFFAYVHFDDPRRPWNPPARFGTLFTSAENAKEMRHAVNTMRAQGSASDDPARARGSVAAEVDVVPALPEEALVALYDGEIACVDAEIARMRRALEDERLLDRTIFVITSGHGEVISAGRAPPVGASLAPELLHVPLIVRVPRTAPRRERGVVDLTRLAPTLVALAGEAPRAESGLNGAGAVRGGDGPPAVWGERMLPPWGDAAARVAHAHTARGRLPGREGVCELVGLCTDGWRLTMEADGSVVEFHGATPAAAAGADGEAELARLKAQLTRWLEECRRGAVTRRFERMDYAAQLLLRDFGPAR